jgi:FkbM family methyltransferase
MNETKTGFSQFGEEEIILKYFKGRKGKFLDVGAYDGVQFSNTHALALAGWTGICYEPNPFNYGRLVETYINNDKIICHQAGVSKSKEWKPFFLADCLSSTDREHIKQFKDYGGDVTEVQAYFVTFEDIAIRKDLTIDFLNLDVEGQSADLFFDAISNIKPELICVEHDHRLQELKEIAEKGFQIIVDLLPVQITYKLIYSNGCNAIFKRV